MRKENILSIIDDSMILKLIRDDYDLSYILEGLIKRRATIFSIIKDDIYKDYRDVLYVDPSDMTAKYQYSIYFTQLSTLRIRDLNWVIENRIKLSNYDNLQLFGLVKLRGKLNETHKD